MHALRGSNVLAVITTLNPIVKGWAAYYRGVVSKRTFGVPDDYMWSLTYKWATNSHPNKSKWWVSSRYFGKFNKFRNNRWVFGDAASGAHLARFSWTDIVCRTHYLERVPRVAWATRVVLTVSASRAPSGFAFDDRADNGVDSSQSVRREVNQQGVALLTDSYLLERLERQSAIGLCCGNVRRAAAPPIVPSG